MSKEEIADTCEELYKSCLKQIPQFDNGQLVWLLNGSTLCNFLCNVVKIDCIDVSEKFNNACYNFIRQPKGDIDIIYKPDRPYFFDLNDSAIQAFQNISKEKRTYNFVDSNDEISEDDMNQLCWMETKSGLKFMAKKPQYLFLYKYKELLAVYHDELLNNDFDSIMNQNVHILNDVVSLYEIAKEYCGVNEINRVINLLPNISNYLNELYNEDNEKYNQLVGLSVCNGQKIHK